MRWRLTTILTVLFVFATLAFANDMKVKQMKGKQPLKLNVKQNAVLPLNLNAKENAALPMEPLFPYAAPLSSSGVSSTNRVRSGEDARHEWVNYANHAYGWLMHLVTDIIVHPLVHKMILETFTEKYGPETDISLNVVEHRRVEWGIDLYIIKSQQHKGKLLDLSSILKSAEDLKPFIQESFLETYQYELSLDTWQNAMEGMIKYVNLFYFIWKLSGRIPDRNPLFQFGKSCFYYSILLPLFKCTEYTKLGESLSVLTPVLPTENQIIEIKECTSKTFSTYLSHLSEGFTILENRTH